MTRLVGLGILVAALALAVATNLQAHDSSVPDQRDARSLGAIESGARAGAVVPAPRQIDVAGGQLGAHLSFDGEPPGMLTLVKPGSSAVLARLSSAVLLDTGATYRFPADFRPDSRSSYRVDPVTDAVLGPARRMRADYRSLDGGTLATIEVVVAERRGIVLSDPPLDTGWSRLARAIHLF